MQWWVHFRNCMFVNVAWRETQEMKVAIFLEDSGSHRTVILRRHSCWNSGQCNFCFLCNLFGLYTECVLMLWNHLAICCTTLYQDTTILCCCSLKFLKMVNLMLSAVLCPWGSPSKNTGVGCHASFRGSSQSRDQTPTSYISCIGRWVLYHYHIKLIKKKINWRNTWEAGWFSCFASETCSYWEYQHISLSHTAPRSRIPVSQTLPWSG